MYKFVKKAVDLFKRNISSSKSNNSEPDLSTAFKTMELENEEAEKQYGKKFFPDVEK